METQNCVVPFATMDMKNVLVQISKLQKLLHFRSAVFCSIRTHLRVYYNV